uniref:Serine protease inhibitor Kazal-type 1 n=1 Tax=Suricata suricatta TaxID=37032 RepID=A0A673TBJ6_SURSU
MGNGAISVFLLCSCHKNARKQPSGCRASLNALSSDFDQTSEYRTPNCNQYKLPGCPRDFSPVCGSDMSTYPNECTLCMKIREGGQDIKIIRSGPC